MAVSEKALRGLLGYRMQRATSAAIARHLDIFRSFGLRRTTFSCLSLIIENPGLQQRELGETLAIERPNLVKIVDDLTRQGLILRSRSASDGRAYALTPTEAGQALFSEALAAVHSLDTELNAGLSAVERNTLENALAIIERNAKAVKP